MSIKKILIILAVLILILSVVFFFLSKSVVERQLLTGVRVPKQVDLQGVPVNFNISESEFTDVRPSSVMALNLTNTKPIADIEEIVNGAGMQNAEEIFVEDPVRGNTYIYNDTNASMLIKDSEKTIEYSFFDTDTTNRQLNEEDLTEIAISQAKRLFPTFTQNIKHSFNSYYNREQVGEHFINVDSFDQADLVQVNFASSNSEYKILTIYPDFSPVYVWVDIYGNVIKIVINVIDTEESGQRYQIKNFNQVESSLKELVLVNSSSDGEPINFVDISPREVSEINIDSVDFAYLYIQNSKILSPIFIFKGDMIINRKPVNATFYLDASAN